jgi:hypothetical protein
MIALARGSHVAMCAVKVDFGDDFFRNFNTQPYGRWAFDLDITGGNGGGAGIYMVSGVGSIGGLFGDTQCSVRGNIVGDNISLGFGGAGCALPLGVLDFRYPSSPFSFFSVDSNSLLSIGYGIFDNANIGVFDDTLGRMFNGDISNCAGDALTAGARSVLEVGNVSGSGNGGVGIKVGAMSQAIVNINGGTTTLTGAVGDTQVGAVVKAYAALPFSEQGGLSPFAPTLNRIEVA